MHIHIIKARVREENKHKDTNWGEKTFHARKNWV